jgi:membrane fusion protein, copper/silver efflux system
VVSGQFLLDSEARLRSVTGNLAAAALPPASAPSAPAQGVPAVHVAEGTVERVDADGITISHGPVADLKWPAMTMGFGKPDPKAFADIQPGDRIRFEFREGGASGYALVSVQKLATGATR